MAETKIESAVASDLTNVVKDYSVNPEETDGATDVNETRYTNDEWAQQLGYYKNIPELAAAIDSKARWTVGKGFTSDEDTRVILDQIKGFGKDTFNTILENMIRTYHIGGDAYAEIIRDENFNFINLKPLDTGSITIVADKKGIIKRYEQNSKVTSNSVKKFKSHELLHLSRNRVADEIHGVSMIDNLEWIILAINEAQEDMKTLMHRHVKPMRIWKIDEDDTTKVANFKTVIDEATNKAENIYIPKDVAEHEIAAVPTNATLSPLPWLEFLTKKLYQAAQVPQFIVGGGTGFTEASEKIAYLAYQQTIEEEQLFIEEQIAQQLGLFIQLTFPASLENELLSDNKKDGALNMDKSETTAGAGQ